MNYLNNLFDKHLTNLFDYSYPMLHGESQDRAPGQASDYTLRTPYIDLDSSNRDQTFYQDFGPPYQSGPQLFCPLYPPPPPSRRPYCSYLMGNLMCYLIILNLHVKYFNHVFFINASLFIKQE